ILRICLMLCKAKSASHSSTSSTSSTPTALRNNVGQQQQQPSVSLINLEHKLDLPPAYSDVITKMTPTTTSSTPVVHHEILPSYEEVQIQTAGLPEIHDTSNTIRENSISNQARVMYTTNN
ncbi:unnamed protein product, partial [Didymodactylos carnosus]